MTSAADDPTVDTASSSDSDQLRVLTFALGDTRYCVRADAVASVLSIADTDGLDATADPWNAGSVAVSGERVRVVDLHRIFESTHRPVSELPEPLLLVFTDTDADGRHYGWLVDDVDVTKTVPRTELEPTRTSTRFVTGRIEFSADGDDDGTEVVLLDEEAIHG
ncbi:chemotaxis protein CheW [Natrialba asiatica]|uniref:CheW protein n=1 Tax=Natrialba asiatica (strain ATCC 700177 / DSM 12278 / JCM 9576 / FERM P-10747 / NBRC 102637 / 172P1) TaxID=29540 RepID=M0AQA3_NATA1|nr:chemotaxis protein CheW [Natrialba asiatica]ELZ00492.1 CheW protein [Natrialba asiatica DSM 12278]